MFDTATPGWYRAALRAIARVHASALSPVNLPPLLLLVAGADHVVSADATRRFAREHRLEDAVVEYPDYFHELLNERPPERAIVIERIAAWIDGLLSERSPGSPEEDRRWGAPPTSG